MRGFLACLAVGVAGQATARWVSTSSESAGFERVLRPVLSASILGTLLFALCFPMLWLALRTGRTPRWLTLGLATSVSTTVLMLHVLSAVLCVMLGSELTSSGVAFFLNSSEHLGAALFKQYWVHMLWLAAGGLVVAGGLARIFSGALKTPTEASPWSQRACLTMLLLLVGAVLAPTHSVALSSTSALSKTPEGVLFSSVAASLPEPDETNQTPLVLSALDSPQTNQAEGYALSASAVDQRPNVIVIMLESVAISHVGYMGYPRESTPNLDRIANESLRMRRAYTTATHSNYAQMAAISSLFPRRGRSLDMYQRVDYPRALLHDVFAGFGYRTATISSQDETWQGMLRFQTTSTPNYVHHALDHRGAKLDMVTEDIVPDEATIDNAIEWIGNRPRGSAFSLYVNLQSTHFPYPIPSDAPRPFQPDEPQGTFNYVSWDRDDRRLIENRYDNALAYVDRQIGRLYDTLAARGELDETILAITSDHGELFFEHDLVTHGRSLFEGEVRVPLLVHYPAELEPGDDDTPVSTLDLLPTILDLTGRPAHPLHQGESFAHLRGDGAASRQSGVYFNIQGWKHAQGLVCQNLKLVLDPSTGALNLFDVLADPAEAHDLATEKPEVAASLKQVLVAQMTAQDLYHANTERGRARRRERFAPRLLPCPPLP